MQDKKQLLSMFQQMASEIAEREFKNFTEETVLSDLGIDSLGMLELVGALEKKLGITLPDETLVGLRTVKDLLDLVSKRQQA